MSGDVKSSPGPTTVSSSSKCTLCHDMQCCCCEMKFHIKYGKLTTKQYLQISSQINGTWLCLEAIKLNINGSKTSQK